MRAVKSLGKCWKLILSHLDLCTYACSSQEMHNQEMHDGVPCIDQLSSNALKQFQSHYILQGQGGGGTLGGSEQHNIVKNFGKGCNTSIPN